MMDQAVVRSVEDGGTTVRTSFRDGVGTIGLSRPAVFNSVSRRMLSEIRDAIATFERDGARAVLIAASGKNFCTGAALDEVEVVRGDEEELRDFLALGHSVLARLEASPLPVVAAVQGLCLAGGIELVLACDVLFAAEDARFGDQHVAFGLIPGWGGSQRLTRTLGLRRALDLMYSARWIDAPTAMQWGLVNHVVPAARLREDALAYAGQLASRSRTGLAAIKRLARHAADADQSLSDGLRLEQQEAVHVLICIEVSEGLAAFRERRAPNFAG
jgi:enoyl-CoA hydratase